MKALSSSLRAWPGLPAARCRWSEPGAPVRGRAAEQRKDAELVFLSQSPGTGEIDQETKGVTVSVPHGTDVTSLVAVFETTGAQVSVDDTEQASGVTIMTSPNLSPTWSRRRMAPR